MDRLISRRDLLQGIAVATASAMVPGKALADTLSGPVEGGITAGDYPPALTGLRGNHAGSFNAAHALALEGRREWAGSGGQEEENYDLVVVGAGISGLAAAHFFRQENPGANILVLDNHDDFGGHSRRNEFTVDGRTLIGYGGGQTLEEPFDYANPTRQLLQDLRVDLPRFDTAYDRDFYRRHGLEGAVFFQGDKWGQDQLVRYDLGGLTDSYLPLAERSIPIEEAVKSMPLSAAAQQQMLRLLTTRKDCMPDIPQDQKVSYLYTTSYRDFLARHLEISEPGVFAALEDLAVDTGLGIEKASAGGAILYSGLPGFDATGLPEEESEPYIHHFPDGNASIARLLVRRLVPGTAPGKDMEDVVTARFDYSALDRPGSPVRIRLNSTATRVTNDGAPASAKSVRVTYVHNGKSRTVKSGACVLACYNAIIPYLTPELPQAQREALAGQVQSPNLYTSVALRNWQAWKKLGIGAVSAPGGYHTNAMLDFPVSLGDYKFSGGPEQPIIAHMERFFYAPGSGLNKRDQFRAGRRELLATPFETIERNVRAQLADILQAGGFDPARDIAGITVNRWAHGYAYMYDFMEEPYYPDWNDERYPHVRARKPLGRISIANSDAGASADIDSAVVQAHRAVSELT